MMTQGTVYRSTNKRQVGDSMTRDKGRIYTGENTETTPMTSTETRVRSIAEIGRTPNTTTHAFVEQRRSDVERRCKVAHVVINWDTHNARRDIRYERSDIITAQELVCEAVRSPNTCHPLGNTWGQYWANMYFIQTTLRPNRRADFVF